MDSGHKKVSWISNDSGLFWVTVTDKEQNEQAAA